MAKAFDFPVPPVARIPIAGHAESYPVRRVFCVGRNYAAHAAEMGFAVDREAPFYFSKSPSAITLSGATVPYPPGTANCHHGLNGHLSADSHSRANRDRDTCGNRNGAAEPNQYGSPAGSPHSRGRSHGTSRSR